MFGEWFHIARDPKIVLRALKYAVLVGAVLILINHGDALLKGDVSLDRIFKMGLTVLVPYCVSTASSVGAIREIQNRAVLKTKEQLQSNV